MAFLVYKLTNTANGKAYVGITARALDTRWLEHCKRAREGVRESRLYAAIRKYGFEAFTREVIATADTEEGVRSLECAFIRDLDTYGNGYNSNLGGNGHLHFPEHIRRKISDAQRGKVISPECRTKMSAAKIGDPRCANHLGVHVSKGSANPRARRCTIRMPDGSERAVLGLRAFCRENGLQLYKLKTRASHKGFVLLPASPAMEIKE